MTERRTGADRPTADEDDTLIRPSRDFYGSEGAPAPTDKASSGPSTNARAQRNATQASAAAPAKGAASPLSRDRDEQPASPVQPRAAGSARSGSRGLTQKGKGRSGGQSASQQKTAQPSAPQQQPASQQGTPQGGSTQGGPKKQSSDNPPTLAERIMKRLPPPPDKLKAQQARQTEGAAIGQGRSPEAAAARSLADEQPTHIQPRTTNHPPAKPAASAAAAGVGAGAAAGAAGAAAASSSPRTGSRASAATTTASRPAAERSVTQQSSAGRAGASGAGPTTSSREVMSAGGGGGRTTRRTRRARLRLARVDPWSVMKTFFLFSMAGGIMACVAVGVVWTVIESSGLFDSLDQMVKDVLGQPGDDTPFSVADYLNWQRVMAFTALLACIDIVIFTALATLGAFLYNLSATMLGGLEVTLAED
ncbi:DUF3566 domain-containing protein [Propionibacteriaceae bacterium Y1685]|uniref:DUF3566 domain-containing protein n=1 Tax=Microlunatus sp. Y1700 TaxID=3418487 RepID=UPI003B7EE540